MATYKSDDILKISKELYARKRGTLAAPGFPHISGRLVEAAKRAGGQVSDWQAQRILNELRSGTKDPATIEAVDLFRRALQSQGKVVQSKSTTVAKPSTKPASTFQAGTGSTGVTRPQRPGLPGGLRKG